MRKVDIKSKSTPVRPTPTETNIGNTTFKVEEFKFPDKFEGMSREEIKKIVDRFEERNNYDYGKFLIQETSFCQLIKSYNESIIDHLELATCHLDEEYEILPRNNKEKILLSINRCFPVRLVDLGRSQGTAINRISHSHSNFKTINDRPNLELIIQPPHPQETSLMGAGRPDLAACRDAVVDGFPGLDGDFANMQRAGVNAHRFLAPPVNVRKVYGGKFAPQGFKFNSMGPVWDNVPRSPEPPKQHPRREFPGRPASYDARFSHMSLTGSPFGGKLVAAGQPGNNTQNQNPGVNPKWKLPIPPSFSSMYTEGYGEMEIPGGWTDAVERGRTMAFIAVSEKNNFKEIKYPAELKQPTSKIRSGNPFYNRQDFTWKHIKEKYEENWREIDQKKVSLSGRTKFHKGIQGGGAFLETRGKLPKGSSSTSFSGDKKIMKGSYPLDHLQWISGALDYKHFDQPKYIRIKDASDAGSQVTPEQHAEGEAVERQDGGRVFVDTVAFVPGDGGGVWATPNKGVVAAAGATPAIAAFSPTLYDNRYAMAGGVGTGCGVVGGVAIADANALRAAQAAVTAEVRSIDLVQPTGRWEMKDRRGFPPGSNWAAGRGGLPISPMIANLPIEGAAPKRTGWSECIDDRFRQLYKIDEYPNDVKAQDGKIIKSAGDLRVRQILEGFDELKSNPEGPDDFAPEETVAQAAAAGAQIQPDPNDPHVNINKPLPSGSAISTRDYNNHNYYFRCSDHIKEELAIYSCARLLKYIFLSFYDESIQGCKITKEDTFIRAYPVKSNVLEMLKDCQINVYKNNTDSEDHPYIIEFVPTTENIEWKRGETVFRRFHRVEIKKIKEGDGTPINPETGEGGGWDFKGTENFSDRIINEYMICIKGSEDPLIWEGSEKKTNKGELLYPLPIIDYKTLAFGSDKSISFQRLHAFLEKGDNRKWHEDLRRLNEVMSELPSYTSMMKSVVVGGIAGAGGVTAVGVHSQFGKTISQNPKAMAGAAAMCATMTLSSATMAPMAILAGQIIGMGGQRGSEFFEKKFGNMKTKMNKIDALQCGLATIKDTKEEMEEILKQTKLFDNEVLLMQEYEQSKLLISSSNKSSELSEEHKNDMKGRWREQRLNYINQLKILCRKIPLKYTDIEMISDFNDPLLELYNSEQDGNYLEVFNAMKTISEFNNRKDNVNTLEQVHFKRLYNDTSDNIIKGWISEVSDVDDYEKLKTAGVLGLIPEFTPQYYYHYRKDNKGAGGGGFSGRLLLDELIRMGCRVKTNLDAIKDNAGKLNGEIYRVMRTAVAGAFTTAVYTAGNVRGDCNVIVRGKIDRQPPSREIPLSKRDIDLWKKNKIKLETRPVSNQEEKEKVVRTRLQTNNSPNNDPGLPALNAPGLKIPNEFLVLASVNPIPAVGPMGEEEDSDGIVPLNPAFEFDKNILILCDNNRTKNEWCEAFNEIIKMRNIECSTSNPIIGRIICNSIYYITEKISNKRIKDLHKKYNDIKAQLLTEKKSSIGKDKSTSKYEILKPDPFSPAFRGLVSKFCGSTRAGYFWYGPEKKEKKNLQEYLLNSQQNLKNCLPYYFYHNNIIRTSEKHLFGGTIDYMMHVLPLLNMGNNSLIINKLIKDSSRSLVGGGQRGGAFGQPTLINQGEGDAMGVLGWRAGQNYQWMGKTVFLNDRKGADLPAGWVREEDRKEGRVLRLGYYYEIATGRGFERYPTGGKPNGVPQITLNPLPDAHSGSVGSSGHMPLDLREREKFMARQEKESKKRAAAMRKEAKKKGKDKSPATTNPFSTAIAEDEIEDPWGPSLGIVTRARPVLDKVAGSEKQRADILKQVAKKQQGEKERPGEKKRIVGSYAHAEAAVYREAEERGGERWTEGDLKDLDYMVDFWVKGIQQTATDDAAGGRPGLTEDELDQLARGIIQAKVDEGLNLCPTHQASRVGDSRVAGVGPSEQCKVCIKFAEAVRDAPSLYKKVYEGQTTLLLNKRMRSRIDEMELGKRGNLQIMELLKQQIAKGGFNSFSNNVENNELTLLRRDDIEKMMGDRTPPKTRDADLIRFVKDNGGGEPAGAKVEYWMKETREGAREPGLFQDLKGDIVRVGSTGALGQRLSHFQVFIKRGYKPMGHTIPDEALWTEMDRPEEIQDWNKVPAAELTDDLNSCARVFLNYWKMEHSNREDNYYGYCVFPEIIIDLTNGVINQQELIRLIGQRKENAAVSAQINRIAKARTENPSEVIFELIRCVTNIHRVNLEHEVPRTEALNKLLKREINKYLSVAEGSDMRSRVSRGPAQALAPVPAVTAAPAPPLQLPASAALDAARAEIARSRALRRASQGQAEATRATQRAEQQERTGAIHLNEVRKRKLDENPELATIVESMRTTSVAFDTATARTMSEAILRIIDEHDGKTNPKVDKWVEDVSDDGGDWDARGDKLRKYPGLATMVSAVLNANALSTPATADIIQRETLKIIDGWGEKGDSSEAARPSPDETDATDRSADDLAASFTKRLEAGLPNLAQLGEKESSLEKSHAGLVKRHDDRVAAHGVGSGAGSVFTQAARKAGLPGTEGDATRGRRAEVVDTSERELRRKLNERQREWRNAQGTYGFQERKGGGQKGGAGDWTDFDAGSLNMALKSHIESVIENINKCIRHIDGNTQVTVKDHVYITDRIRRKGKDPDLYRHQGRVVSAPAGPFLRITLDLNGLLDPGTSDQADRFAILIPLRISLEDDEDALHKLISFYKCLAGGESGRTPRSTEDLIAFMIDIINELVGVGDDARLRADLAAALDTANAASQATADAAKTEVADLQRQLVAETASSAARDQGWKTERAKLEAALRTAEVKARAAEDTVAAAVPTPAVAPQTVVKKPRAPAPAPAVGALTEDKAIEISGRLFQGVKDHLKVVKEQLQVGQNTTDLKINGVTESLDALVLEVQSKHDKQIVDLQEIKDRFDRQNADITGMSAVIDRVNAQVGAMEGRIIRAVTLARDATIVRTVAAEQATINAVQLAAAQAQRDTQVVETAVIRLRGEIRLDVAGALRNFNEVTGAGAGDRTGDRAGLRRLDQQINMVKLPIYIDPVSFKYNERGAGGSASELFKSRYGRRGQDDNAHIDLDNPYDGAWPMALYSEWLDRSLHNIHDSVGIIWEIDESQGGAIRYKSIKTDSNKNNKGAAGKELDYHLNTHSSEKNMFFHHPQKKQGNKDKFIEIADDINIKNDGGWFLTKAEVVHSDVGFPFLGSSALGPLAVADPNAATALDMNRRPFPHASAGLPAVAAPPNPVPGPVPNPDAAGAPPHRGWDTPPTPVGKCGNIRRPDGIRCDLCEEARTKIINQGGRGTPEGMVNKYRDIAMIDFTSYAHHITDKVVSGPPHPPRTAAASTAEGSATAFHDATNAGEIPNLRLRYSRLGNHMWGDANGRIRTAAEVAALGPAPPNVGNGGPQFQRADSLATNWPRRGPVTKKKGTDGGWIDRASVNQANRNNWDNNVLFTEDSPMWPPGEELSIDITDKGKFPNNGMFVRKYQEMIGTLKYLTRYFGNRRFYLVLYFQDPKSFIQKQEEEEAVSSDEKTREHISKQIKFLNSYTENIDRVKCINGMKSYEPDCLKNTQSVIDSFWSKPYYINESGSEFNPTPITYLRNKSNIISELDIYYYNKRIHEKNTKEIGKIKGDYLGFVGKYSPKMPSNFDKQIEKESRIIAKKTERKDRKGQNIIGKTSDGNLIVRKPDGTTEIIPKKKHEKIILPNGEEALIIGKTSDGNLIVKKSDGTTEIIPKKKHEKVILPNGEEAFIIGKTPDGKNIVRKKDGTIEIMDDKDLKKVGEIDKEQYKKKKDISKDIKNGDYVTLPDGTVGEVIGISPNGDLIIRKSNGEIVTIPSRHVKKFSKDDKVDKSNELIILETEFESLKRDRDYNEKIIQELLINLKRYRTDRLGFESEDRQQKIAEYERRQKELIFIKNSLKIKTEQIKSLKILIQSELERNKEMEEYNKQKLEEEEKSKLKKMKHKMRDISKKQHEKNKKLDMKEREKEIAKLKKESEKYNKLYRKKSIAHQRYKRSKKKEKDIPIFSSKSDRNSKKPIRKVKRPNKRSINKKKEDKSPLKEFKKSVNKYFTV